MPDVCVVGSFMMDLVLRAPRRPQRGETVLGTGFDMFLGGKGFNQAIAATRSGASTAMIGRLGDDDFGRRFLAALDTEDIDAKHVILDKEMGTGVGMPLVEETGDNSIVVVPRANHGMTAADVRAAEGLIAESSVLLLQFELPLPAVIEAAHVAHQAGTTVILNPAPAAFGLRPFAGLVDYVVPNEAEAAALSGKSSEGEGMVPAAQALQQAVGAKGVVLTLGERGIAVIENGSRVLIDSHSVECVDSVGAGDAFCGGMAASLARGATLIEAARYGNAAGALAVTVPGAEPSMPRQVDIESLLAASRV